MMRIYYKPSSVGGKQGSKGIPCSVGVTEMVEGEQMAMRWCRQRNMDVTGDSSRHLCLSMDVATAMGKSELTTRQPILFSWWKTLA